MMIVPAGVKVHLALGYTDMRKGLDGLAMLVQQTLKQDPCSGHLFAFRGKKASMLKILFWDGNGLCLFTKRLDQGSFAWPVMACYDGSITLDAGAARDADAKASTGVLPNACGDLRWPAENSPPIIAEMAGI